MEQVLGKYVYVVSFEGCRFIRDGGCILESSMKIHGNLALRGSLGILRPANPSILDAASEDFNLSKCCAIWGQEMKREIPFHIHQQFS